MKKLLKLQLFLLTILSTSHITVGHSYPLSNESKKNIAIAAAVGAGVCGGFGFLAALDELEQRSKNNPEAYQTLWSKIKALRWNYVGIPAIIGGAISGLIRYYFTPEKYLSSAQNELDSIEHDFLFKTAIENSDARDLKKWAFGYQFPTLETYHRLDRFYSAIRRINEYCIKVIDSGISPLVSLAKAVLVRIEKYQEKIVEKLAQLKEDPQYLREYLIYSQAQIAAAQHRLANAAYLNATRPRPIPVIIVRK